MKWVIVVGTITGALFGALIAFQDPNLYPTPWTAPPMGASFGAFIGFLWWAVAQRSKSA